MKNLWPKKFGEVHTTTPKETLSIQANFLTENTSGKLQGIIKTSSIEPNDLWSNEADEYGGKCFSHSFSVYAPQLDFQFSILKVVHSVLKIYPFTVHSSLSEKKYNGEKNEHLEEILGEIFSEKAVIDALESLVAQSPD